MDDLKSKPGDAAEAPRLPKAIEPARMLDEVVEDLAERAAAQEDGRNPIFDILVRDEADLDGLVAYALYKQNKRDWLIAFEKSHGRRPDPRELASYILGERTPRRIETYRRLAGDALAAHAATARPAVASGTRNAVAAAKPADSPHSPARSADVGPISPAVRSNGEPARQPPPKARSNSLVTVVSVVVVAVVIGFLAWKFGGSLLAR
jgi:hypothetical protein